MNSNAICDIQKVNIKEIQQKLKNIKIETQDFRIDSFLNIYFLCLINFTCKENIRTKIAIRIYIWFSYSGDYQYPMISLK